MTVSGPPSTTGGRSARCAQAVSLLRPASKTGMLNPKPEIVRHRVTGGAVSSLRNVSTAVAAATLAIVSLAGVSNADTSGPTAMGYTWTSNQGSQPTVAFRWFDISESGDNLERVSGCDDCIQEAVPIGFAFPFYGRSFDSIHVNSNGTLQFQDTGHHWGPDELPAVDLSGPVILSFWSDWDPASSGDVYVETLSTWQDARGPAFVVQWEDMENYDCDNGDNATWQTVLLADGRIFSQYLDTGVGDLFCSHGADMTVGVLDVTSGCYVQYSNRTVDVPDHTAIMWSPTVCGAEEPAPTAATFTDAPTPVNGPPGVPPAGSGPVEGGPDPAWLVGAFAMLAGGTGLLALARKLRAKERRGPPVSHP